MCINMGGPGDYHIKWNKPDRERQISYDTTYMWNLKHSTQNELIYKTEIDSWTENKLMVENKHGYQWGRRGKGKPGSMNEISRYTRPYVKQINNRNLLFSTRSTFNALW